MELRDSQQARPGRRLLQWVGVTLLLTLAFLALFQVVGPDLQRYLESASDLLGGLIR